MKSHKLARYVAPPPPPKPTCNACKAYAPEVIVPLGEGAIELCWLCAHHHVDHGVPLSECATSERCEHTPAEIYPWRQPDALEVIAVATNRGEAMDMLQANGMSRQQAKEATFMMDAHQRGMGPLRLDGHTPVPAPNMSKQVDAARSVAISRGMRAARKSRG